MLGFHKSEDDMRYGLIVNFAANLAVAVSLLASCGSTRPVNSVSANRSYSQEVHLEIPKASWEPIFFREIDKRAKKAKLPSLRSALPDEDLEARFWHETGSLGMDGIIIRRRSGAWSGTYIHGISRDPNFKQYDEQMPQPRSGWDLAWKRLVEAGLLTLPDASQIGCFLGGGLDMPGFVFETNVNKTYRTYMYQYREPAACEEAKQIAKLVDILTDEFNLHRSASSP
jgi:hypothetical protein